MGFGALSSGISALRSFSKGMEVIGNNIANVNTVAYKGTRIKYAETFNQVLQQSAPSPTDGKGSNVQASQIGLGVQVQGIVGQFTQGGLSATALPTDLAISGEGFFLVKDDRNNGASYATRGGDFRIDDQGYLVTSGGMRVQGKWDGSIGFEVGINGDGEWTFTPNQDSQTGTITPTKIGDIRLDYNKGEASVVNSVYDYGNPDTSRNAVVYTNHLVSRNGSGLPVWGSVTRDPVTDVITSADYGADSTNPHRVGNFILSEDGTQIEGATGWHAFMEQAVSDLVSLRNKSMEGQDQSVVTDAAIAAAVSTDFFYRMFSDQLPTDGSVAMNGNAVRDLFITDGNMTWPDVIDADATINSIMATFPANFADADKVMSQVRADKTPDLSEFSIDAEGTITYFLANGESFARGQIMLIDFNDKTALIREGENLYSGFGAAGVKGKSDSNPTGLEVAGRNGLGRIQQGALELSNVDLTNEFAQMITTQRGFQAGSRIITVSDEILQEVVNLKR